MKDGSMNSFNTASGLLLYPQSGYAAKIVPTATTYVVSKQTESSVLPIPQYIPDNHFHKVTEKRTQETKKHTHKKK